MRTYLQIEQRAIKTGSHNFFLYNKYIFFIKLDVRILQSCILQLCFLWIYGRRLCARHDFTDVDFKREALASCAQAYKKECYLWVIK